MKLKFIKPSQIERNLKATVHRSGKLGFTVEASDKLKLSDKKTISIATNEESEADESLYIVVNDSHNEDAFKIGKAGDYYYVNTKLLFDSIKLDYTNENKTIMFDISEDEYNGDKIYVFKKREVLKKQSNSN